MIQAIRVHASVVLLDLQKMGFLVLNAIPLVDPVCQEILIFVCPASQASF